MASPRLYLMVGYPGAGKTTVSKIIHKSTGAAHLWADERRRQLFGMPTYSHRENQKLYEEMNHEAKKLLKAGYSVVYDTNFNFYQDRQLMARIAKEARAHLIIIWVNTPESVAKVRATSGVHTSNRALGIMSEASFDRLSRKMEPPRIDETVITINGENINPEAVKKQILSL